jgi:hypothetical protein
LPRLTEHEVIESSTGVGRKFSRIQWDVAQDALRTIEMTTVGVQNEYLLPQWLGEPQRIGKPERLACAANEDFIRNWM